MTSSFAINCGTLQLRQSARSRRASRVSTQKDFARMVIGAKSSIQECRGQLRDAVDCGHITAEARAALDAIAEVAVKEMAGLIDYLQSPEAEENARRIRARSSERRAARLRRRQQNANNPNPNPNPNQEPPNDEPEPQNRKRRTRTRTRNLELGTRNWSYWAATVCTAFSDR